MQTAVLHVQPAQSPILANLLELYIHDFSEFLPIETDENGRFGYPALARYWQEPHHYPLLVRVDGHWAGFALLRKGSQISGQPDIWDMAEFFILRAYRRRGLGTQVAQAVWERFPGKWEVRVIDRNAAAGAFWARAIADFLGQAIDPMPFKEQDEGWHFFPFESKYPSGKPINLSIP